ncbi:MAG: hypothetical protein KJP21_07800 [Bacteroidia bacterium]|nr:hypothetical protein [Bacteroidia bacterium]
MFNNKIRRDMKFNYLLTKMPYLAALSLLFSLASCGSYEYVGYDNDGIYGSETRNVEYQTEKETVVQATDNSNYYKNYFKEKSMDYEGLNDNGQIFTDIDSYQGEYNDEVLDSLQYENAYAGWGQNNDDVTINIYNNGWNNWGWNYWGWNRPWRYNYGWGWNNWGWNAGFGWGWNDPWIWNGGFYGNPYYGYGYGYGYYGLPYHNNYYYGGIYNRRNYAYNNSRRGSILNRNSSILNRNTSRTTLSKRNSTYTRNSTNTSTTPRRTTRSTNTRATTPRSSSPRVTTPRSNNSQRVSTPRRSSSSNNRSSSTSRSSSSSSRSSGSTSSSSRSSRRK